MTRFADLTESLKPAQIKRAGLDNFGSDKCDLCGVTFDVGDAKVWTQETGKVHFKCYLKRKEAKK